MAKIRTTLTIDEEVLRAVKVRGARTGKGDSEVIEAALRRELGLDLLERLWQRDDLGEDLDPNILIAALLSPSGAPAKMISRWLSGEFELVVSVALLAELERALAYPKLRRRIAADDAAEFVSMLRLAARLAPDPETGTHRSADPGDDYLLALAESERAVLVSGDRHILGLADDLPILTARAFLDRLARA